MDLRNLSSTPNQLDSMQRRPSISSLSSASGYTSSTYGNPAPQLSNQRINQARMNTQTASAAPAAQAPPGGSSWLNQTQLNNVAPWVEQQQQQQQDVERVDEQQQQHQHQHQQSQSQGQSQSQSQSLVIGADNDADSGMDSGIGLDGDGELDSDDELIPTAIVIKNIPFAIKKEQLLDVMTKLNLPLPYAFNYHFDNGVFRGLAFANFTLTNETSQVVNLLNGREIGGRKLRVEYKKMLPLKERERIEREKREKRGQLEEQHRSNSNASLALLMSTALTTAATKNLSVNGTTASLQPNPTERLFVPFPSTQTQNQPQPQPPAPIPPLEINFNEPEILELYTQLVVYRDDVTKAVFELAFLPSLSIHQRKILSLLANFLNLLEFYDNGVIIIRRKPGQSVVSRQNLTSPPSHSSSMMNLSQYNQSGTGGISGVSTVAPGAPGAVPELLRSLSQSAIPLAAPPRNMQSSTTPIQLQFPQYQNNNTRYGWQQSGNNSTTGGYQHSPQPQHAALAQHTPQPTGGNNIASQASTPTSAAALLRSSNNRSFVDVRATQFNGESPTPNHHYFQQPQQVSQPGTPLPGSDINSRFAPFGQHMTGSYTSLQQQQQQQQQQQHQNTLHQHHQHQQHTQQQQHAQQQQHHHHQHNHHQQPSHQGDEYEIHQKFNGLKLGQNYDASPVVPNNSNSATVNNNSNNVTNNNSNSGSNGIWGPK